MRCTRWRPNNKVLRATSIHRALLHMREQYQATGGERVPLQGAEWTHLQSLAAKAAPDGDRLLAVIRSMAAAPTIPNSTTTSHSSAPSEPAASKHKHDTHNRTPHLSNDEIIAILQESPAGPEPKELHWSTVQKVLDPGADAWEKYPAIGHHLSHSLAKSIRTGAEAPPIHTCVAMLTSCLHNRDWAAALTLSCALGAWDVAAKVPHRLPARDEHDVQSYLATRAALRAGTVDVKEMVGYGRRFDATRYALLEHCLATGCAGDAATIFSHNNLFCEGASVAHAMEASLKAAVVLQAIARGGDSTLATSYFRLQLIAPVNSDARLVQTMRQLCTRSVSSKYSESQPCEAAGEHRTAGETPSFPLNVAMVEETVVKAATSFAVIDKRELVKQLFGATSEITARGRSDEHIAAVANIVLDATAGDAQAALSIFASAASARQLGASARALTAQAMLAHPSLQTGTVDICWAIGVLESMSAEQQRAFVEQAPSTAAHVVRGLAKTGRWAAALKCARALPMTKTYPWDACSHLLEAALAFPAGAEGRLVLRHLSANSGVLRLWEDYRWIEMRRWQEKGLDDVARRGSLADAQRLALLSVVAGTGHYANKATAEALVIDPFPVAKAAGWLAAMDLLRHAPLFHDQRSFRDGVEKNFPRTIWPLCAAVAAEDFPHSPLTSVFREAKKNPTKIVAKLNRTAETKANPAVGLKRHAAREDDTYFD